MRILQINSARNFGGGERHLVDLVGKLQNAGHQTYIGVRPRIDWREKAVGADFVDFPLRNSIDILSAAKIASFMREKKIEIIHAHVARDYPIAATASLLANVPLVVTRHLTYKLGAIHRLTFRRAAAVVAVSRGVRESLAGHGFIPDKKIHLIANGVATNRFDGDVRQPKDNGLVVATVGDLAEHKGHEAFLYAAARVLKILPATRFLIIGGDKSKSQTRLETLKTLAEDLKIAQSVVFTGWIDEPATIYRSFDIFVSSAENEPFGLAIAEAMASGKPIVATATDGARELITNEESGVIVPIGDEEKIAGALLMLLPDEKRRREFGAKARRKAISDYSLETMVVETTRLYETILQAKRKRSGWRHLVSSR